MPTEEKYRLVTTEMIEGMEKRITALEERVERHVNTFCLLCIFIILMVIWVCILSVH